MKKVLRLFLFQFLPLITVAQNKEIYPISEKLARLGMNLPSYPELNEDDIKYITNSLKSFQI